MKFCISIWIMHTIWFKPSKIITILQCNSIRRINIRNRRVQVETNELLKMAVSLLEMHKIQLPPLLADWKAMGCNQKNPEPHPWVNTSGYAFVNNKVIGEPRLNVTGTGGGAIGT